MSKGGPQMNWRSALAYLVMISPNAAVGMVLSSMPAALPLLAAQLGGRETAQIIGSLASLGVIVGGTISGGLLERWAIRGCLLTGLTLYAVCAFGGMLYANPVFMGASRFILGIAAVIFSSAAVALATAAYSGAARSRILGLQQAASQFTNVACVLAVGALATWVGWRSPFLVLGAYATLVGVIAFISVKPDHIGRTEPLGPEVRGSLGFNFWRVCAIALLFGVLQMLPMTQLPFLLADAGANGWISGITSVSYVFAIVGAVSYVRLKRRLMTPGLFFSALLGMTCGAIIMGLARDPLWFSVASAIVGLGTGIGNTFLFDHGVEVVSRRRHGRAAGLLFSSVFLGTAINPLVLFPFDKWLGQRHSLLGVAAVAITLGALAHILRRPSAASSDSIRARPE